MCVVGWEVGFCSPLEFWGWGVGFVLVVCCWWYYLRSVVCVVVMLVVVMFLGKVKGGCYLFIVCVQGELVFFEDLRLECIWVCFCQGVG